MDAALPQGHVYQAFVNLLEEEEPIFLFRLFTLVFKGIGKEAGIKSIVAEGDCSSQDSIQTNQA